MRKAMVITAAILGIGLVAAGLASAVEEVTGPRKEMMGHAMTGHRGMADHRMMMFCPFATPGAEIQVTPTKSGATIEVTASDPTAIARIQKKAQILQLMHELRALGPENPHEPHESDQPDQSKS